MLGSILGPILGNHHVGKSNLVYVRDCGLLLFLFTRILRTFYSRRLPCFIILSMLFSTLCQLQSKCPTWSLDIGSLVGDEGHMSRTILS